MQCPACRGPLIWLGKLGNLTHVKCRDCGLEAAGPEPEPQEDCDDTHRLCAPEAPEGAPCPDHPDGRINRDCLCESCQALDAIEA